MELSTFYCFEKLEYWKPQNWKLFDKLIISKIPALANGEGEVFAKMRVAAENGATEGKFVLAKRAKALNLDAIHDTVHEMARDEARHGKAFEGLLNRYFK